MRQRRDAGATGPRAGKRPVVGPHQVLVGTVRAAHERRRHQVLSRPNSNRIGAHGNGTASILRFVGLRFVLDERHTLAIDGHVDVLKPAIGAAGQIHLKDVLPIGGKHVRDRHPASCAERRAFDAIPRVLRGVRRVGVGAIQRGGGPVAHGHAADLAGCVHIRFEQRRGQHLFVRDVVEIGVHRVERQPLARVHDETKQFPNRPGVLGAVQSGKDPASRIRVRRGCSVESRLEHVNQCLQAGGIRRRGPGRRHHARAQFAHHPLGHARAFGRVGNHEGLKRLASGLSHVVVTIHAVVLDQRVGIECCDRRRTPGTVRLLGVSAQRPPQATDGHAR